MEESVAGVRTEPLQTERAAELARRITGNLRHVMHAPDETLDLCVLCLFAEGHLIIEDLPGVGKTTLAKALARSLDLKFSRIQFTPDLLPSDVTGVNVYSQSSQEFAFRPGPVFANVLLVDEINRTSPKTQAALLEAMQERQVTVDGATYPLDPPFIVMATQNPIEYEGTYPLPEAQLDRFTMRISHRLPAARRPRRRCSPSRRPSSRSTGSSPWPTPRTCSRRSTDARGVYVEESVSATSSRSCATTRGDAGSSSAPARAPGSSCSASRRRGRSSPGATTCSPTTCKAVAAAVLAHRLILAPEARASGLSAEDVVREAVESTSVPA